MAVLRDRITVVPPDGETVTVDILESSVSLGTVYAERTKPRTLTLPLAISERTSFFVPAGGGPYSVSVLLGTTEIAGDGAPVTVSSFPAEIHAAIDTAELTTAVGGSSGGSVAVGAMAVYQGNTVPFDPELLDSSTPQLVLRSDFPHDADEVVCSIDIESDPNGNAILNILADCVLSLTWHAESFQSGMDGAIHTMEAVIGGVTLLFDTEGSPDASGEMDSTLTATLPFTTGDFVKLRMKGHGIAGAGGDLGRLVVTQVA